MSARNANPAIYRADVLSIGNFTYVGKLLHVPRETMSRRCNGHVDISKEASLAIKYLKHKHQGKPPVRPARTTITPEQQQEEYPEL